MAGVTVIADELTAALLRLAGATVIVPEESADLAAVLAAARAEAALLLITAEQARRMPRALLDEMLVADAPLTLLMADARSRVAPPDWVARTRRVLGVEG